MSEITSPLVAAHRWRRLALSALLVAEAMNLLDATIVQVAAPTMRADLGGDTSDIQWFGTTYTLPFAVLLITGGRLGDSYGRRRVFGVGVTGFPTPAALHDYLIHHLGTQDGINGIETAPVLRVVKSAGPLSPLAG
jgi:MFS family permease